GRRLAFADKTGVYVAHDDGGSVTRIAGVAVASAADGMLVWSPDNRTLACSCGGAVVVFGGRGGVRPLSGAGDGKVGGVSWSSDGRRLAYASHCTQGAPGDQWCAISVVSATGTNRRTLIRQHFGGASNDAPVWLTPSSFALTFWDSGFQRILI